MFNICPGCDEYNVDKIVKAEGEAVFSICPICQTRQSFRRLPLFLIGGLSATGKSTLCREMVKTDLQAMFIDWDCYSPRENFGFELSPKNESWYMLRFVKNISQCGWPCVVFGWFDPEMLSRSGEFRYLSELHICELICEAGLRADRMAQRAVWRRPPGDVEEIDSVIDYFLDKKDESPDILTIDTAQKSIESSVGILSSWLRARGVTLT